MLDQTPRIDCLFVDIGGVLLSNGWGHEFRHQTALRFDLDFEEMEHRHQEAFEPYENDKLSLRQYLSLVVFHRHRQFSEAEIRDYIFGLSTPYPEMIELVKGLKSRYGLKIVVVSNEARETNAHRIEKFGLGEFVDFFLSSAYLQIRKPDPRIYRLALDLAQVRPEHILYLEDTAMFVEIAETFGINSILHRDFGSTCASLRFFGLEPASVALA